MTIGVRQLRRLPVFGQLWQRLEAMPPTTEIENSIWLRVLVQALVIVGIIATDIAAETQTSFWAVPLSIVGAIWSWYHRRGRNITLKFLLAIGMLLAMGVFFGRLFAQLNDTRLVLAELLIQLQVLHSFDLPRRKDLGYSMVIGLILLGVAGTLSQTFTFAPLLAVFLAIALPVLVLDYQSRLGLSRTPKRKTSSSLARGFSPVSLRRLALFLLIVTGLGLGIFALMPRFPGYQLQTFPVGAPANFGEQNFESNNRGGIINPGYAQGTQGNRSGSGGQDSSSGVGGQMDETFYYGFNSKIDQNLRGTLKPKVVLRVRSQAPGFWRVLAFDRYTGQGWEISRQDKVDRVNRPEWSYRFYLPTIYSADRTREVVQSYTAVSELPNLMPALSYPKELYFPSREIEIDTEGSLRAPASLIEGVTYTVISDVPYRDRSLLQKASTNYPLVIKRNYLDVPAKIRDRVRKRAEELLATSPNPITSPYEKALYLAQALKQKYSLPTDPLKLPQLAKDEDLVEAFLFKNSGGYPDHFSTVLTIMLRSLGIPARLMAGFDTGEFNPFTGFYVVKNIDAFALTEVYFPQYGWFAFDPIPGRPLIPQSIEETETFGVVRQFWQWVAGWLPTPVKGFVNAIWNWVVGGLIRVIAFVWGMVSNGWVGFFTGLILAIAVAFLGWLSWNQWRTWRYRRWLAGLPAMESLYQQMLRLLSAKGYPKHPAQTPLEYARVSHQYHSSDSAGAIDEISQAYVRWRYGNGTPNIKHLRERLRELIKSTQQLKLGRRGK
jgi:transglutaminase-like putative cysteine protease